MFMVQHGTNSAALLGIFRFNALLPMKDLMEEHWFARYKNRAFHSGEHGNTIWSYKASRYHNQIDEPDRYRACDGISLYKVCDVKQCVNYAKYRMNNGTNISVILEFKIKESESTIVFLEGEHPFFRGRLSV
ncbi:hypothetical protein PSI23_14780 [Xenorhabdus sp. XENO-10]|uniref:Uncharacterized protein n=1 Tax=Xenorhabdus yunnanensis TaxID=3025878 RepID=A0ABT5LHD2_9GAMM|nr:hypothetical protein [Xenorhabdus yunnanensis]MDC9590517.1 hypothetical protein [Xenorhabdus yunnanensis]